MEESSNFNENSTEIGFTVTGGRDDNLLKLLSRKMNFLYEYVDPPERTQGQAQGTPDNLSFTGGLGMLQRRVSLNKFLPFLTQKTLRDFGAFFAKLRKLLKTKFFHGFRKQIFFSETL
jgi:hypothetical protein